MEYRGIRHNLEIALDARVSLADAFQIHANLASFFSGPNAKLLRGDHHTFRVCVEIDPDDIESNHAEIEEGICVEIQDAARVTPAYKVRWHRESRDSVAALGI